jgi:calcineurin-like phosphoesterase family protein
MIYFTADTHFYHSNIIGNCDRPFDSVEEMNKVLIQNWNSYVTNHDDIYILGDLAYKASGKDYFVLNYEKRKFILFHYPMFEWDGSYHKSIHLYGHVHNSGVRFPETREKLKLLGPRAINVGVDVNDFYPVSIKQILDRSDGL